MTETRLKEKALIGLCLGPILIFIGMFIVHTARLNLLAIWLGDIIAISGLASIVIGGLAGIYYLDQRLKTKKE